MIKFQKYYVADTDQQLKARVHYSVDNRCDGRECVTIYAKDYSNELGQIFPANFKDDTDIMTDYIEKGRVVLFPNSPHYETARTRATLN